MRLFLNIKYVLLVLLYPITLVSYAQISTVYVENNEILTLEGAISMALEHNELVRIADANAKIADLNTHIGMAGLLPKVYLSGDGSTAVSNSTTIFAGDTPDISLPDAKRDIFNGLINLSYNLYDGGSKFHTHKINTNNAFMKFWELKKQKESVVMLVVAHYLNVVKSELLLKVSKESLKLSQDRLKLATLKYNTGAFDKLQYLNAKVAKNTDSIALISQQLQYKNVLRLLMSVVGVDLEGKKVETEIGIQKDLNYESLKEYLVKNNTDMKINEINRGQSVLNLKIEKAKFLPKLDLNADYGYRDQQQTGNFVTGTNSIGWNVGVTLNYTLFDGVKRRIGQKQAVLKVDNAQLQSDYDEKMINADFENQYDIYESQKVQLDLEAMNQNAVKLNYERSLKAFQTGSIQGTALREAQVNLTQSQINLVNILIDAKQAEMNLYKLTGQLVE